MVRPAGDVMPQFRTEGYGKAQSLPAHTFPGSAPRPNAQARVRRPPFCSALLTKSSACCAHSASATSFSRTDCLKASRRASSSKIDSRWFLFCFFVPASIVRCQEPQKRPPRVKARAVISCRLYVFWYGPSARLVVVSQLLKSSMISGGSRPASSPSTGMTRAFAARGEPPSPLAKPSPFESAQTRRH